MPSYKLTIGGDSCKSVGIVEEFIKSLDAPKYNNIKEALEESQGGIHYSFLGNFEEEDLKELIAFSCVYPNNTFRLACCYYEMDPEDLTIFEFKNGQCLGEHPF